MKKITVEVTNEQLDALEDILTSKLSKEEYEERRELCLTLWQTLVARYDTLDVQEDRISWAKTLYDQFTYESKKSTLILDGARDKGENVDTEVLLRAQVDWARMDGYVQALIALGLYDTIKNFKNDT